MGGRQRRLIAKPRTSAVVQNVFPRNNKVGYLPGSTNLERGSQAALGILWKWGGRQPGGKAGEHKLPALSDLLPLPNFSPPPSPPYPQQPPPISQKLVCFAFQMIQISTDVGSVLWRRQILKGDALSKPNRRQT